MKRYGPDSLNSWLIALACCFCNTIILGLSRLSGMLFIASVSRFNVSREKASLPYNLSTFMRNTSGPIVGFLGHRFGVRSVTTVGCFIGAVGVATCFFAEKIDTVIVLWGVVFGLGYGPGNILLPLSINQHFDKHRATASGLSLSGACFGSFILPPILDLLITNYGLSGAYLLLSGLILNCVPAALLLKEPNFITKSEEHSNFSEKNDKFYTIEDNREKYVRKDCENVLNETNPDRQVDCQQPQLTYAEKIRGLSTQTLLSQYSIRMSVSEPLDVNQIMENSKGRRRVDSKVIHAEVLSLESHDSDQEWDKDDVFEMRSSSVQYDKPLAVVTMGTNRSKSSESLHNKSIFITQYNSNEYKNYAYMNGSGDLKSEQISGGVISHFVLEENCQDNPISKSVGNNDNLKNTVIEFKTVNKNISGISERSAAETSIAECKAIRSSSDGIESKEITCHGILTLILKPIFILISFTYGIYTFIFVCLITIIVDFARDLNIESSNEKYILMTLSIGDIIGRLSLVWITDRGYMTTTGFTALLFACQGITISAIVLSRGLMTLLLFATLYGFAEAGIIVLFPVILTQYIDHDKQSVAIPLNNFLAGSLCLTVAPLIGLCRDRLGTYAYLYYGMALMSFACCFLWILAPTIAKCQKKNRRSEK